MPVKSVARTPRKVTLPKLRASEILSGLHVTPSERQHAKRAVAAAKKTVTVVTVKAGVPGLRGKTTSPPQLSRAQKGPHQEVTLDGRIRSEARLHQRTF